MLQPTATSDEGLRLPREQKPWSPARRLPPPTTIQYAALSSFHHLGGARITTTRPAPLVKTFFSRGTERATTSPPYSYGSKSPTPQTPRSRPTSSNIQSASTTSDPRTTKHHKSRTQSDIRTGTSSSLQAAGGDFDMRDARASHHHQATRLKDDPKNFMQSTTSV